MTPVPLDQALALAGALFALGAAGLLARRNVLIQLVCVEVLLNAAGLALVAAGAAHAAPDGQVLFLFVLATAAAEVAVALALVQRLRRANGTLDVDAARRLGEAPLPDGRGPLPPEDLTGAASERSRP